MSTTYTSTISINCWKQHTCVGCGALFRYRFSREVTGSAGTPEGAEEDAEKTAAKVLKDGVEPRPCPTCGLYQPEMIGARRASVHGWSVVVAVLGLIVVAILAGTDVVSMPMLSWWCLLTGIVVAAGNVLVSMHNPNADLEANGEKAVTYVGERELYCDRPGSSARPRRIPGSEGFTTSAVVALVLVAAGSLLTGCGEAARLLNGWAINRDCHPPIVGTGDTVRIYLPDSVTSLKGLWSGRAAVSCANGEALGLDGPFTAAARSADWGESIYTKGGSNSTSPLWADVTVPEGTTLRGDAAELTIDLEVTYPSVVGGTNFENVKTKAHHEVRVVLSSAHAAGTYRSIWWASVVVGGCLAVAGAFMLWMMAHNLIDGSTAKCLPMAPGGAVRV